MTFRVCTVLGLAISLMVGCSGNPSKSDIEGYVMDKLVQSYEAWSVFSQEDLESKKGEELISQLIKIKHVKVVNSMNRGDSEKLVDTEFDVEFRKNKVDLDSIERRLCAPTRSGDSAGLFGDLVSLAMGAALTAASNEEGENSALQIYMASAEDFKKGDTFHVKTRFVLVKTDNGWDLARNWKTQPDGN